jgi:DNA-binding NtrC family response regulator
MVYGTVQSHSGAIEVTSVLGAGSEFSIYLPTANAERVTEATKPSATPPIIVERRRVLVIDDDVMLRGMLQRALRAQGRDVIVADCAEQGLAVLERGSVDLVILDMMMPGMGGAAGFARMRERLPDLKVILVSGYTDRADVDRCLDRGAVDFLSKPFPLSRLGEAVARAFGEHQSGELVSAQGVPLS